MDSQETHEFAEQLMREVWEPFDSLKPLSTCTRPGLSLVTLARRQTLTLPSPIFLSSSRS